MTSLSFLNLKIQTYIMNKCINIYEIFSFQVTSSSCIIMIDLVFHERSLSLLTVKVTFYIYQRTSIWIEEFFQVPIVPEAYCCQLKLILTESYVRDNMSIKRHTLGPTYEIHKQCRDNEIM